MEENRTVTAAVLELDGELEERQECLKRAEGEVRGCPLAVLTFRDLVHFSVSPVFPMHLCAKLGRLGPLGKNFECSTWLISSTARFPTLRRAWYARCVQPDAVLQSAGSQMAKLKAHEVEYQTTLAELQEKEAFARTQACEVLLSFHSVVLILL